MSLNLYAATTNGGTVPRMNDSGDSRTWGMPSKRDAPGRGRSGAACPMSGRASAGDGASLCLDDGRDRCNSRIGRWPVGRNADAPASYLRTLPPDLAASCINNGLAKYEGQDVQFLVERDNGRTTMRAMTTAYSRLWNADVVRALKPATEAGWMIPPARPVRDDPRSRPATLSDIVPGQDSFGLAVKVGDLVAPGACFASDRDMFALLVNPRGPSTSRVPATSCGGSS